MPWRDPATTYVLTGCPEWRTTTKSERRALIEAFSTNTKVRATAARATATRATATRATATLARVSCVGRERHLSPSPLRA